MEKKDKNLTIGISTEYDATGAERALADAEKIKQAAATTPQPSGTPAAGAPQGGGSAAAETALANARKETAEATTEAAEASKDVAKARKDGENATSTATDTEEELAQGRKDTAAATDEATAAEAEAGAATQQTAAQKQQAAAQNSAAATKEQKEIELLRAQMALEAKGRSGLIKELERLSKARMKAAKAGDVKAFKALEAQMIETRKAFERMNQGLEVTKLGFMGQMQTAFSAASALGTVGEEIRQGSIPSLMSMANALYALGIAWKAGLGPVGWGLLAVQALSEAWKIYADSQEEAAVAEKQRAIAELENMHARINAVLEIATAERKAAFQQWGQELEGVKQHWEEVNQKQTEAAQRAAIEAAGVEERRRIAAQATYDREADSIELAKVLGKITEEEATRRLRAAEEVKAAELLAIDEAEARRTSAAHIAAKDRATREAKALEEELANTYGKFDDVLKLTLPTNEEWDALQKRFNAGLADYEDIAVKKRVKENIGEFRELLAQLGIAWQGGDTELLAMLNSMKEARKAGEERVRSLRATAEAEGAASREIVEGLNTRREQDKADAERREAKNDLDDARLASSRLAQEWQEKQRASLEEQAAWLEKTAASFAEGSAEAKKWADALRAVKLRQITEELNGLNDKFKLVGNYAEKDSRLQVQIHEADAKALRERREALQRMKAAPDIDAATLRAINAKLRETDAQARGLRRAMQESAFAAQQALASLRPLGQKARTKNMQSALERSERAFVKMAKQAERQASRGDTEGMERTMAAMKRYALQQERLTGYTGRAAGHMRATEGRLRAIAQGTAAQDRGLTAAQRQQNRVLESLGQERRYRARASRASQKAASAKEREAKASESAAKDAAAQARKQKPKSQARQVQELTNRLNDATRSMSEQKAEVLRLQGGIDGMANAAAQGLEAATACANAAAAKYKKLDGKVETLRRAVERLRKG